MMKITITIALALSTASSLGCSSTDTVVVTGDAGNSGGDTGNTVPADTYTPPLDTGPTCSGLSGTYDATRVRSTTTPGSCPSTYTFVSTFPVRIAVDSGAASGYKVELGYTDSSTGGILFVACASVNASGCTLYATCKPDPEITDQATLTIDGNSLVGKIERNDAIRSCTITFNVTGKRR